MEWIEQVLRVDPDHGSGMVELAVALFLSVALAMLTLSSRGRASARAGRRLPGSRRRP